MNRAEQAAALFKEGFSCSQAVFSVFAPDLGVDREKALKLASAFGGGIGRTGETCGAVSGAIMAIGLKYGRTRGDDEETREKTYALAREFMERFGAKNDTTRCKDLLGVDIGTPEGLQKIREDESYEEKCTGLVRDAVEILEDML